ncbi:MAG: helix-turn-helix transcriptional regulator [Patescibacteria group bacterium]
MMRPITPRQREVLAGICNGETAKMTAARLGIATCTVEVHRSRLRHRLGAKTTPHLVKLAMEQGALTV